MESIEIIVKELEKNLIEATKKELGDSKEVALLFSGGLDSALVGKILEDLNVKVIPITVGLEESKDIQFAKEGAKIIFKDKNHQVVIATRAQIEEAIKEVIRITNKSDMVTVSVGSVIYIAAKEAAKHNQTLIFSGTGSDELFAGYESHQKAMKKGYEEVQKECKNRYENIWGDLKRDTSICKYFNLDVKAPFLDENVVKLAFEIDPKFKISESERKIILRRLAKDIGIARSIYERKKDAAQYGSGFQKEIKRISKAKGFKTIKEYIKSTYDE